MKYISIDLETTGVNPKLNQILEFGAVIEDTNNPLPYDELPSFQTYIDNGDSLVGSPFALQMNSTILKRIATKEEGYTYVKPTKLGKLFKKWLQDNNIGSLIDNTKMKITVAGKNFGSFDLQFLNNCKSFNKHIQISKRIIDPAILFVDWENDIELPNLKKCKELSNIEGEVTHNAVEDAIDVIKVLRPSYSKQ